MFRGKGLVIMKDLFKRILNRIWHDVYLAISFTILRPLAMTCRQATDFRNTEYDEAGTFALVKYRLHLSICDACTKYLRIADYFEKSLAAYEINRMSEAEADKFNQHLIKTFRQN